MQVNFYFLVHADRGTGLFAAGRNSPYLPQLHFIFILKNHDRIENSSIFSLKRSGFDFFFFFFFFFLQKGRRFTFLQCSFYSCFRRVFETLWRDWGKKRGNPLFLADEHQPSTVRQSTSARPTSVSVRFKSTWIYFTKSELLNVFQQQVTCPVNGRACLSCQNCDDVCNKRGYWPWLEPLLPIRSLFR